MTTATNVETQVCTKCNGTGSKTYGYVNVVTYPCSLCKGVGRVTADRIKRVAAFKKATDTKAANRARNAADFREAHPELVAFIESRRPSSGTFMDSVQNSLARHGHLSEKQVNVVSRVMADTAARAAENQNRRRVELGDSLEPMFTAMAKASMLGLKAPKLRTKHITFSVAKESSKNAGAIYVKAGTTYIGKIVEPGVFHSVRDITEEQRVAVIEAAKDPLVAAVEYGRATGVCACCGRELTDDASVAAGIGPVCKQKFF